MRRIVATQPSREALADIPFGKRESEDCGGGVVRIEGITQLPEVRPFSPGEMGGCERGSVLGAGLAMLDTPHLAYCDGQSTIDRVSYRITGDLNGIGTMVEAARHCEAQSWEGYGCVEERLGWSVARREARHVRKQMGGCASEHASPERELHGCDHVGT